MEPDLLRHLANRMPAQVQVSCNHRQAGTSPEYIVTDQWSFNLYDMPGLIVLPERRTSHRHRRGTVCLMPPGLRRQFITQRAGTQWVVHFTPADPVSTKDIDPMVHDAGSRYRDLRFLADSLLASRSQDRRRAAFWHLLWLIADLAAPRNATMTGEHHVDQALLFIRRHLADPIKVVDVVAASSCSHSHLARLFRQELDLSIVAAIRHERMQRAQLLLEQTDLPIRAVGVEVGICDPQLFNKTVRRHFGRAPSTLRAS